LEIQKKDNTTRLQTLIIPKSKITPMLKDNFLHYFYSNSLYYKRRIKLLKDSDNYILV